MSDRTSRFEKPNIFESTLTEMEQANLKVTCAEHPFLNISPGRAQEMLALRCKVARKELVHYQRRESVRLFPNHFVCILVFPQTEKHGLAQSIITRPLC